MEFKVIKILNRKEIVIDYGKKDGAELFDKFAIYEEGEKIIYNGKDYGKLNKLKEKIYIVAVFENFSICQKIIDEDEKEMEWFDIGKIETMNVEVEEKDITSYISNEPIRVGDIVEFLN